jgi:hypothetical protein
MAENGLKGCEVTSGLKEDRSVPMPQVMAAVFEADPFCQPAEMAAELTEANTVTVPEDDW